MNRTLRIDTALSASILGSAAALLIACSSNNSDGSTTQTGSGGGASSGSANTTGSGGGGQGGPFAACGGNIVRADGTIDPAEYKHQATLWDAATIDCRLGPKFADTGADTRPTAYEPPHQMPGGYLCPVFELSGSCSGSCDFGSTSGQALYAPASATETGVDRIQSYAYESGHICESIASGAWLGGPHPDPGLTEWTQKLGRPVLLPNGFSQTEMWETNAGIMIFPDGLVGATGNQTSGDTKPYFQLPPNKVPTAVSVSTYNEFAFVTIWDTDAIKAQVAVFALRADKPEAFSVPYFAMPNEGGFSAIHLMGYVDLPDMTTPTAIAISGDNGNTPGGHVPGFEYGNQTDPTQNIITSQTARDGLSRTDYERRVPMTGQVIIASRWENKVTFLDFTPLAQFVRNVYFGPDDALRQSAAAKDVWPFTFDTNPEAKPVFVTTIPMTAPTVVRIGNQGNSNDQDLKKPLKAWVGNLAGEVHVFDVSAFADGNPHPVPPASIVELAHVQAGRNLTSMTRQGGDSVLVTSRQDRIIQWVGIADTDKKTLAVLRTLSDTRIGDPVSVDASDRGPVVTISDFTNKKLLNFRYGPTENNGGKPPANYGCGDGGADASCANFEFGGELSLPGNPFFVGTTNVN